MHRARRRQAGLHHRHQRAVPRGQLAPLRQPRDPPRPVVEVRQQLEQPGAGQRDCARANCVVREILPAGARAEEIAERLADAGARGAAAERDYDRAANELRALIGDARGLKGTNWKATWSNADGSPRWKDIAKELGADTRPDLVAKHTAAPSRRFTFTKGK